MNKKIILVFLSLILILTNVFSYLPRSEMKIFAVTSSGEGMDANLIIEVKPGSGKIFSNVNSQIGSLTQESERNAVLATEKILPKYKDKYDYFFEIQSVASSVDGPSAGAAMSLLLVSMLSDTELSGKVSITGTITADGYVGDVGGIAPKAKKASEIGVKLFMIPLGTRKQVITTKDGSSQVVDLPNYAYDNWGLKIVEVETIEDILNYSKMNVSDIDINKTIEKKEDVYYPEKIEISDAILPMRELVDNYLISTKEISKRTENSINTSAIKDSSIVQSLLMLFDYAKESIVSAEKNSENNYLYTSANEFFLAKMYLITIDEIVNNPSIISSDSTIYNIRLKAIEKKIEETEQKSKECSLDDIEWCISARQRITWAKNKIEDIKHLNNKDLTGIDKIMDYSYALAWIEIADDFLNIGIDKKKTSPVFVESPSFKEISQKYIVELENQMILASVEILQDEDLQRRVNAAKKNFEKGWYVTSLYDVASAKAVLSYLMENNNEAFSESVFLEKYNSLTDLRSSKNLSLKTNVWSKLYFDHTLYHYKQYQYFKAKNTLKAETHLKVANSIVTISKELFIVENIVLDYYNDISDIDIIISEDNNTIIISETEKDSADKTKEEKIEKVYVYKKEDSKSYNFLIYVMLFGLFLMVITIAIELEKQNRKKQKLYASLYDLEKRYQKKEISKSTYDDMKKSYLEEIEHTDTKNKIKKIDSLENLKNIPRNRPKPKKLKSKGLQK